MERRGVPVIALVIAVAAGVTLTALPACVETRPAARLAGRVDTWAARMLAARELVERAEAARESREEAKATARAAARDRATYLARRESRPAVVARRVRTRRAVVVVAR